MEVKPIQPVYLPLNEAAEKAAKQCFDSGVLKGKLSEEDWDRVKDHLIEEMKDRLERDGKANLPEYPHTEHVHLQIA